ncbi:MAG: hypothetical protein K9M51_03190 [Candidatus Gracilibacteria bacterium]|nr:hypothetical protein [Candidatus Gracilibacteria bacterium]
MKKSNKPAGHFMLAQEVYKNRNLQLASALLLFVVLGLQIYQLLTINALMQEALESNIFF